MSKQTKQTLIGGALILTLATLITKLVGWVYNLFVADLWLHGDGMGYYNVAYSFYNPISILAIAGFPAAIAKIVSGYNAQQRYADIRALKKASSRLFLFIGIAGTLVLALFSFPFANYVFKNPRSVYCMLAIAPSIFFSSLVSARRGYDQGFRNMKTTAASQIIEVLAKTAFGLAACYFSLKYLRAEYAASGTVLGEAIADAGAASALILALVAAATIFSVTVSVAVSYLYYVIRSRRSGEGFTEQQVLESPPAQSQKYYMKLILSIGIPIAVSSLVSSITGMIDTAMLQSIVGTMMEEQPQAIYDAYHGLLDGKQADQVANFLYGSYSAYACKIYNLIPMLTSTFSTSALPLVSEMWELKDHEGFQRSATSAFRMAAVVSAPIGFGCLALAGPILSVVFSSSPLECAIATMPLRILGGMAIIDTACLPMFCIFNAAGRVDIPVKLTCSGAVLKVIVTYVLLRIPSVNILAAPIANVIYYVYVLVVGAIVARRLLSFRFPFWSAMAKPAIAGALCGAFALLAYHLLPSGRLFTLLAIAVGGIVYLLALVVLHVLPREDVASMPGGRRLEKLFERLGAFS